MIRPCLRDLINNHKPASNSDSECGEWKIQLVMQNNCISVKYFEDSRTIYSKSKPVEIFMGNNTDDAIDRLFDTLLQRFQQVLQTSIKESEFTHESVTLLYYYFQKIDIRRAESYTESFDWLKYKGATINPKNKKHNKCFQWSTTLALNYNKI